MRWMTGLVCMGLLGAGGARAAPVVREEAQVQVGTVTERWRLEWKAPPRLACFETEGVTCPCQGFAQGETGDLELVRERPETPAERLSLSALFGEGETKSRAVLQGWKPSPKDGEIPSRQRQRELQRRPRVKAMVFGDYDHDGQAREFVLLTGALACGLREAVLIGVDRRDGRLRALGTSEHPERPLVLEPETWAKLLTGARIESVQTPCGDHGSELEEVLRVHADAQGLHATRTLYQCTEKGERGAQESSEVL